MIVFDIDGTLSIPGSRLKYIQQPKKDWESFYSHVGDDLLNVPIARICVALQVHNEVIFVTGRPEWCKNDTIDWLNHYGLLDENSRIYMRCEGDYRPDHVVKPELINHLLHKVEMVFEDRQAMVDKWRELGITCLQVAKGDY